MKTVILTILVFGVIIMLHESGHFLFAKLFHVKVEEFSFGMGPKLWSRIKRGTQYTIRAFPIGGYVAMEGEDDAGSGAVVREKIVSAAEGGPLYEKPAWQRFIIMAAGAVMNVILGFIILIVVTAMSGLIGTTTVAVFDEDSVSANYLQAGDEIIKVNGYNTRFYGDATFQMLRDQDGTIDFTLIRDGEVMEVTVPFRTEELSDGITGMHMDFKFLGEPVNFSNTITYAWHWTFSLVKQVWYSVIDVFTGRYGLQAISGPVGTATIISQASSQGLRSFLLLVAYITINVGVFNLLPLPALDGGRILFVLIDVTAQGTAFVACADVLAQIVMLELLCPGLPIIATTLLFSMDMQSTYTLQSNTEITFARLICMDLFERGYNIRAHSYGTGTDSLCLDAQNFIERTSLIHAMAMSNASVLGGMGQLETAKTISPVQLIIDNEIMGIAQRLRAGLDVNDETIDWDELIEGIDKDPAFSFLMSEHTFRHFEEPHRPDMFNRDGVVRWEREGSKTLLDKAEEKYYALMAEEADYALPADKTAAVDEVLKKAHAALVKD